MADPTDSQTVLYFSAKAAESQGSSAGDTPQGRIEFTAQYSTPEAGDAGYGWADKQIVWQGKASDLTNVREATPRPAGKEMLNDIEKTGTSGGSAMYWKDLADRLQQGEAGQIRKVFSGTTPQDGGQERKKKLLEVMRDAFIELTGMSPIKIKEPLALDDQTRLMVSAMTPPTPNDAWAPVGEKGHPLNLLICQDARDVHSNARTIVEALTRKGYHVRLNSVNDQAELVKYLDDLKRSKKPAPDAVFMDVGGVGTQAAMKVIKWFDENHPEMPLPALNFLSLSTSMAINEASRLSRADDRVRPSFVDPDELRWTIDHLKGKKWHESPPESATFREILNRKAHTSLPLNHKPPSGYAEILKKLSGVTNDGVMEAWMDGKLPAGQALDRIRSYAEGVATALKEGLYGKQGQAADGFASDASFYSSAGFPARGRAVFSLAEADRAYQEDGKKPVLFMQSYDPEVVPVLASGKLGGLVVTSPYMASHLKLLCETHMVSGLFGMIPPGKSLTSEFNEEARPDLPPYFPSGQAQIAGKTVGRGQEVLVGLGGNGVALNPPPADPSAAPTAALTPASINHNEKLRADLRNLRQIERCFSAWFRSQGLPVHGVKANVDSGDENVLAAVKGIGLVRTEQMVATSTRRVGALKRILLQGDDHAQRELKDSMSTAFSDIVDPLRQGKPVKVRLYDFVHSEILNPQEQKQFIERYGKLDIHGGEALSTWPDLYRNEAEAVLAPLRYMRNLDTPLEIMMPAVKTEEDAIRIKEVVDKAAKDLEIPASRYRFGVMIETLESCKNIAAIAKHCDFISFGTNDLTSEYFNMSRADLKAHAGYARKHGFDPFKKLAPEVLEIMEGVVRDGRAANPSLKIDVCGAQAADPDSAVALFHAGIDNVSVAPTLANLYALPTLMNYKLYDEAKAPAAAATLQQTEPKRQAGLGA